MDSVLGLFMLVLYVVGMVTLAGLVTLAAIKIFPTKDRPSKKSDDPRQQTTTLGRVACFAERSAV